MTRMHWYDKVLKTLEEPRQLIDNRGSAQANPPCIPYMLVWGAVGKDFKRWSCFTKRPTLYLTVVVYLVLYGMGGGVESSSLVYMYVRGRM